MSTSEHILVGYDGSDNARLAVRWAANEAAAREATLRLVSAFLPPAGGTSFGLGTYLTPEALDDMKKAAEVSLKELATSVRVDHPTLTVETEAVMGGPSGVLVEASAKASLTVVGSRGFGGFRGLLLGSVGTQVATHAHGAVVVVRGESKPDAHAIVVGVDASKGSRAALAFAFDMASRHHWTLVAVHAWEVPSYDVLAAPVGPPAFSIDDLLEGEQRVPAEALAGFSDRYSDVRVEEVIVKGDTVRSLLDAAHDASMIVVGSRGHGELVGTILGSIGQGVLHRADIPVAVVRGS